MSQKGKKENNNELTVKGHAAGASNLVEDGRPYLLTNPLLSPAPALSIMPLVFALNMAGGGLGDA
jgi:ABC-type dipeptide/oligopeptide/nickel transport system permease subunit